MVRRCTEIEAMRRLVILEIGDTATPDGRNAWRSNHLVATQLDTSEDTVRRARKEAAVRGFWIETQAARGGRGGGRSAVYQLTMPAGMGSTGAGDFEQKGRAGTGDCEVMGSTEPHNPQHTVPESPAPVRPPSVNPSGVPSERDARASDDGPLDVEIVPEPDNALPRSTPVEDEQPAVVDGVVVDALRPDVEPERFCPDHRPWGTGLSCAGCKIARLNHEAWVRRNPASALDHLRDGPSPVSRKVSAGMALAARLSGSTQLSDAEPRAL